MYNKKYIDIITLALVIVILILINIYHITIQSNIKKVLNNKEIQSTQEISVEQQNNNQVLIEDEIDEVEAIAEAIEEAQVVEVAPIDIPVYPKDWYIMIPSIDLVAPIEQGTTDTILNRAVGHFEESSLLNGNICLAAHNRGYDVNYFEKVKKLSLNDVIIYQFGDIKRNYSVSNITIIKETDWSYIKTSNSNQNKLTLITCVENEPEYRLCIQATEIK